MRQQFFWQLEEQRTENQADLSSWHCPGRRTSRRTSTRRSTVSSSEVKRKEQLLQGLPAQLHPPGQACLREGSFCTGTSRPGLSQVLARPLMAWPRPRHVSPAEVAGDAGKPAGHGRVLRGQLTAASPVVSSCRPLAQRARPWHCASLLLHPKSAKVTFAEPRAAEKLCLFQTSQGEQTRESQSVLSQLMQLIRIVLNSESK